jgi:peptide chain release factor 1
MRPGGVFDLELVAELPGLLVFRASGPKVRALFENEAGGHRWQRVPPTEKRGRVHTSTVTVAVLEEPSENELKLETRDVEETTTRGSGPGGQHRNKTDTCVVVKHLPTGITARVDGRSQWQNRQDAWALLRARIWEGTRKRGEQERAQKRREQIGSGMRGDKRRTIRTQDGTVTDHVSGQRWRLKEYLRGEWAVE